MDRWKPFHVLLQHLIIDYFLCAACFTQSSLLTFALLDYLHNYFNYNSTQTKQLQYLVIYLYYIISYN
jgi:hypothetical protein